MTGWVVHDDVQGILPVVPEAVVVRGYECISEVLSLNNLGAPLERAGNRPVGGCNTASAGNIVAQAACSVGIARGGVEELGAEGNLVFPGSAAAAEIVAAR